LSYGRSRYFIFLFFMLKISRIRTCENNKSCSIFNHKSNKIGFAIFRILYNFLHILQVSAKLHHYRRCTLAPRPSERFQSLQLGPRFADKPFERNRTSQLGPWPRGTAGSSESRRLRPHSWAGSGSGSSRSSPRAYWWPWLGQGGRRRRSSTAAGGGGRGGVVSGEETTRVRQSVGRACRASAREGSEQLTRRRG
jgi:hypothetical protein